MLTPEVVGSGVFWYPFSPLCHVTRTQALQLAAPRKFWNNNIWLMVLMVFVAVIYIYIHRHQGILLDFYEHILAQEQVKVF